MAVRCSLELEVELELGLEAPPGDDPDEVGNRSAVPVFPPCA